MTQIERITKMEEYLEESSKAIAKILEALEDYEKAQPGYKKLCDYYGSTKWMDDYDDDKEGKLPKNLKRGVLSEDAVYDLIQDNHELTTRLLKIITKNVEGHRA